jgi:hypothetical protein
MTHAEAMTVVAVATKIHRKYCALWFGLGALTGLLFGISVPYFFSLVAMILRHCGG